MVLQVVMATTKGDAKQEGPGRKERQASAQRLLLENGRVADVEMDEEGAGRASC